MAEMHCQFSARLSACFESRLQPLAMLQNVEDWFSSGTC